MDSAGDYSKIIPPFVAPKSPNILWKVMDYMLEECASAMAVPGKNLWVGVKG